MSIFVTSNIWKYALVITAVSDFVALGYLKLKGANRCGVYMLQP